MTNKNMEPVLRNLGQTLSHSLYREPLLVPSPAPAAVDSQSHPLSSDQLLEKSIWYQPTLPAP